MHLLKCTVVYTEKRWILCYVSYTSINTTWVQNLSIKYAMVKKGRLQNSWLLSPYIRTWRPCTKLGLIALRGQAVSYSWAHSLNKALMSKSIVLTCQHATAWGSSFRMFSSLSFRQSDIKVLFILQGTACVPTLLWWEFQQSVCHCFHNRWSQIISDWELKSALCFVLFSMRKQINLYYSNWT